MNFSTLADMKSGPHESLARSGAARGGGTGGTCPPSHVGGAYNSPTKLRFFSAFVYKKKLFYHICKMKWPEFEAKIKIGGLEKLGEWCAPPRCKCIAAPLVARKTLSPCVSASWSLFARSAPSRYEFQTLLNKCTS